MLEGVVIIFLLVVRDITLVVPIDVLSLRVDLHLQLVRIGLLWDLDVHILEVVEKLVRINDFSFFLSQTLEGFLNTRIGLLREHDLRLCYLADRVLIFLQDFILVIFALLEVKLFFGFEPELVGIAQNLNFAELVVVVPRYVDELVRV